MVRTYFEILPGKYTISLMWRMIKPLWVTVKTVIMHSGVYVLKVLVVIYKRGVCVSEVAKNRRYWLSGISGNQNNENFEKVNS